MRLNKMKESVIKSGTLKSPETELLLPDNICPECGCEFRREIYTNHDSYVWRTLKTKINTGTLCLIFGIILVILGCVALSTGIEARYLNEGISIVLIITGIFMIIGGTGLLIYVPFSV